MTVTRRDLLAAAAGGGGALAGCLSDGGGTDGTTTDEVTTTASTTAVAEPTTADGESTTAETTTTGGATVVMQDRSFTPRTVEVEAGATVTWSNADSYAHDVTSARFRDDATAWDYESESVESGGTATYTFEEAGVYEYYCSIHGQSNMCGAVLVGGTTLPSDLPCSGGYG
ncbi:plastocyanin/azurin family copper-binding protein [Halorubellus sp. PRR65]|uniref:cupredoxin domain-containing protein n=1 Tax=Halorubellus sp. PRR65 TaxID=3098148 RepID=UPI002B264531|nr:plastocyanin/azurin family copper-binding protein [Halorubellus sp. PRR65]